MLKCPMQKTDFTAGASLAACLVLGKKPNGQYFVDSDKQWDVENVLSDFVRRASTIDEC